MLPAPRIEKYADVEDRGTQHDAHPFQSSFCKSPQSALLLVADRGRSLPANQPSGLGVVAQNEGFWGPILCLWARQVEKVCSQVDIDCDVVDEERQGDFEWQTNVAYTIRSGEFGDRINEGQDTYGSETEGDNGQVQHVYSV